MERELKLLLAKTEADRLVDSLGAPLVTIHQINYYLDDRAGTLRNMRLLVRLREESLTREGKTAPAELRYTLAVKGAAWMENQVAVRPETEVPVLPAQAREIVDNGLALKTAPIAQLAELETQKNIRRLFSQGSLINLRRIYRLRALISNPAIEIDAIELALDETFFSKQCCDYEVELELPTHLKTFPSGALEAVRHRFEAMGIGWKPGNSSKFSRWLLAGGGKP